MHLGLMLDASGSMQADMKLAQSAAIKFLNMLPEAEDITLVDFDTQVRITRYPQRDFRAAGRAHPPAQARRLDGALRRARHVPRRCRPAGGPQGPRDVHRRRRHALGAAASATRSTLLKASRVTVYAIGLVENTGSARQQLQMTLRQIAEATGGQAFFPSAMKEVESAYEKVLAEINGPVPPRLRLDQHRHRRRVAQGRHQGEAPGDLRLRARKGYFAPYKTSLSRAKSGRSDGVLSAHASMPSVTDRFHLASDFELAGDQVHAVPELVDGLNRGDKHQVLLGVTGSGKTYSMAQVIARVNRPTLVMAHNKTLAAQLFQEFRRFFPENAVEYFVSYYDYYQPEAYMPA